MSKACHLHRELGAVSFSPVIIFKQHWVLNMPIVSWTKKHEAHLLTEIQYHVCDTQVTGVTKRHTMVWSLSPGVLWWSEYQSHTELCVFKACQNLHCRENLKCMVLFSNFFKIIFFPSPGVMLEFCLNNFYKPVNQLYWNSKQGHNLRMNELRNNTIFCVKQ